MPGTIATKTILNFLHFSGLAKLSKITSRNVGSILMLHRVMPETGRSNGFSPNAHLCITPDFLDELLTELSAKGFEFVDLDEAKRRIDTSEKHKKFISITLDDGYKDNKTYAAPIFEKHNAPYTIFVAPGLVDGRATLWWEDLEKIIATNDRVSFEIKDKTISLATKTPAEKNVAFNDLIARLTTEVSEQEQREIMVRASKMHKWNAEAHRANSIMKWSELKQLSKTPLCSIGAHTIHHYAVARLTPDDCQIELNKSASEIETILGAKPIHFAYPYGYPAAAGERDFEIAKQCGFETAVTTRHGVCFQGHRDHITALPRISINGLFQQTKYVNTLLSGAPTFIQNKGKKLSVS